MDDNKKQEKNNFKEIFIENIILFLNYIKNNWIVFFSNTIVYFFPIIIINPSINNFVVNHFIILVLLIIPFYINIANAINESKEIDSYKQEIKDLKQEKIDSQQYLENVGLYLESLPNDYLKSVSVYLNLKNSERISLYVWIEDEVFIIGRYSEHPMYNRRGRTKYSSNIGYIAKCLQNHNGEEYYVRENLPKRDDSYIDIVYKETGMSIDDIQNLSMKSRSYFTRVIKDRNNENVGILVIESTSAKLPIEKKKLDALLKGVIIPHMSTLLDISNKLKLGAGGNDYES